MEFYLVLIGLPLCSVVVYGACPDTSWEYSTGGLAFSSYGSVDADTDAGFFMESIDYHVPEACTCGVLKEWKFYPKAAGAIQFQIWELQSNNLYILKGENYVTVPPSSVDNEITWVVPIKDRVTVRNGYLIGWYGATSGIIGYREDNLDFPDEQKIKRTMGDLAVGASSDWSDTNAVPFNARVYAIGASVTANTAPGFNNLPRTVYIYRTTTAGTFIYRPEVDDIDENDVAGLLVTTTVDSSGTYIYTQSTGEVRLGSIQPSVGDTTFTFTVSDQCGNTNTGVLTITVLNFPPRITSAFAFADIPETTTIETELGHIAIADEDDSVFTFSAGPRFSPTTTNIELKNYGQDNANRTIVSKQGVTWSYTTAQQYEMKAILQDPQSAVTLSAYFLLYISKNDPPKFTNLNNAATANTSYLTTASGDVVYTVSVTDAEDDPLTFALTCSSCPFAMRDNALYATSDLLRTYVPGYDVTIAVNDGTTTIDAKTLTIIIYDINDKPAIVNPTLQFPLVVFEGTALGTTLYTVYFRDVDTSDSHTIQATYNPTWGVNYFELNITSGVLATAHTILDYEYLTTLTTHRLVLSITVSDGLDWDTSTVTIDVGNVNEAPEFHQSSYRLLPNEEGALGASAGDPLIIVNDPDAGDTKSYHMDCGSNSLYFYMSTAGAITYSATFDLDTTSVTVPFNCSVTVTDSGGLSASTILEIDVQDINDNAPVFPQGSEYIFVQPHTLADGRFVGQVSASDADKSTEFNTVYYRFSSSPFLKSYLYINEFGNIYVNESWAAPTFDYGKVYELVVEASNAAQNPTSRLTATTTVLLILPGTSTTIAVTTDRPLNFEDDSRNVAWLMVAGVMFLVLFVILCGFLLTYIMQNKSYRWCIPWFRKHILRQNKQKRRQKRRNYMDILEREALQKQAEAESSPDSEYDSEEEYWAEFGEAPSMSLWAKRGGEPGVRTQVPRAARYDEPKPPLKRALSRMMLQKGGPKIFDP